MHTIRKIVSIMLALAILLIPFGSMSEEQGHEPIITDVDNGDGTITRTITDTYTAEDAKSPEEIGAAGANVFLDMLPTSDTPEETAQSGEWVYTLEEHGWAILTGYQAAGSERLQVPNTIDGHPVYGISDNAFENCGDLRHITIPLGIHAIGSQAFDTVREQVWIQAPFGSYALKWAEEQGISHQAITDPNFTDQVIDFSNARAGAFQVNDNCITISGPESIGIEKGSVLFSSKYRKAFKVVGLAKDGDRTIAQVAEPETQEVVYRLQVDVSKMNYNPEKTVVAEGVTITESKEKESGGFDVTLLNISFKKEFKDETETNPKNPGKFSVSGYLDVNIKTTVTGQIDIDFWKGRINKLELVINQTFKVSVGLEGKIEKDIFIAKIVFWEAMFADADTTLYFHLEFSGKLEVSYSTSAKNGFRWDTAKKKFVSVNEHDESKSIEATLTAKAGVKVKAGVYAFGAEASMSGFAGLKLEAKQPFLKLSNNQNLLTGEESDKIISKKNCIDLNVSLLFEIEIKIKIPFGICDIKQKLLEVAIQLGNKPTFHLEYHQGRWREMGKCTYDDGHWAWVRVIMTNGMLDEMITTPKHERIDVEALQMLIDSAAAEGYEFDAFYLDPEFTQPYDYSSWVVEDMTLFGRWFKNPHSLNVHDSVNGSKCVRVPAEQPILNYVKSDFSIMQYRFQGYYLDDAYTQPVTEDTLMPGRNTDIYVKWQYDESYNPFEGAKSIELLKFELKLDQTYKVVSCKQGAEGITIPDEYRGKRVTEIASNCFDGCDKLVMVKLNQYITTIGAYAFCDCTAMRYTTMPSTLKTIGAYAYKNCSALQMNIEIPISVTSVGAYVFEDSGITGITIPEGVSVQFGIAMDCASLTTARIPESWKEIPANSFAGCTHLNTINIPSTLETIGAAAFMDCESLVIPPLPSTLKKINDSAFSGCTSLAMVTIPSSCTVLGESAFYNCTSLKTVNLPNTITYIRPYCFAGDEVLEMSALPSQLQLIGKFAFERCYAIKSLSIPETVTSIGEGAFRTTGLTSISFPQNIDVVPARVCQGCTSLTSIWFHEGMHTIETYAFNYCKALETVSFPTTMRLIKAEAFSECDQLSSMSLNNGLLSLGNSFIRDTPMLTSLSIPSTVSILEKQAFKGCYVETLTIPEGHTSLPVRLFDSAHCKHVHLPSTLTSFGTPCFTNCPELLDIYIPYGVTYIGAWEFGYCPKLRQIWIPPTVTSIMGYAFKTDLFTFADNVTVYAEPDGLVSVWIEQDNKTTKYNWVFQEYIYERPDGAGAQKGVSLDGFEYIITDNEATIVNYTGTVTGTLTIPFTLGGAPVTKIAEYALHGQYRSVNIPASVTQISETAFQNAPNLNYFNVDSGNPVYDTSYYTLYKTDGEDLILVRYPPALNQRSLTLRNGTTEVGPYAFHSAKTVREITFPSSVKTVESFAFDGCDALETINLQNGVTFISDYAFGSNEVNLRCRDTEGYVAQYASSHNVTFNLYTVNWKLENEVVYTSRAQAGSKVKEFIRPEGEWKTFTGWYTWTNRKYLYDFDTQMMPFEDLTLYGYWSQDFTFTTQSSEVTITGYQGAEEDLLIPEEIGGLPVTGIAANAFVASDNRTYGLITIPTCVTTIADNAIAGVSGICGDAGYESERYANANGIPFTVRKYTLSFDCCYGSPIEPLKLAAGETIQIPETIRDNCHLCGWFTSSSYEHEWTETVMPPRDFELVALWTVIDGVSSLDAFRLEYPDHDTAIVTGFESALTEVEIPETINGRTVIGIGEQAFANNRTIMTLRLPDTVRKIGREAFRGSNIAEIDTGNGLEEIGEYAFAECTRLEGIELPGTVTEISEGAFSHCTNIRAFEISENVETIEKNAFQGDRLLLDVTIGTGVATIGENAFADCEEIQSIQLPVALTTLGDFAFAGCTSLEEIRVADGNAYFNTFENRLLMNKGCDTVITYAAGNKTKELIVPATVTTVKERAFLNAAYLETIVLPASLNLLGEKVFAKAKAIKTVIFSGTALSILPEGSFAGCTELEELVLPENLLSIGDGAFRSSGIAALTVPESLMMIGDHVFANCGQFVIIGPADSIAAEYCETNGYRFIIAGSTVPATQLELPVAISMEDGLGAALTLRIRPTNAEQPAIIWSSDDPLIASVNNTGYVRGISKGITCVHATISGTDISAACEVLVYADDEEGLVYAILPQSIREIEDEAFANSAMEAFDLSLTQCEKIGTKAFANSQNLKRLILPATITEIADDAFDGCDRLKLIVVSGTYGETYAVKHNLRYVTK